MSIIIGSKGEDIIDGTDGSDIIISRGGDDLIVSGDGDDVVIAGSGDDTIYAGAGDDLVVGGSGDDEIYGEEGNDLLFGNKDDDKIIGGSGNDILIGGSGHDEIEGGTGDDIILGGSGNDTISDGAGADVVFAGSGDDTVHYSYAENKDTTSYNYYDYFNGGSSANDTLKIAITQAELDELQITIQDIEDAFNLGGLSDFRSLGINLKARSFENLEIETDAGQVIDGTEDDDVLTGGAGNDTINGAGGNDTIDAGDGNDTISDGDGDDNVLAGNGDDTVTGSLGNDNYDGGAGTDTLDYSFATSTVTVDVDANTASGADIGVDTITAFEIYRTGSGNDDIREGANNSTVFSGAGADRIEGSLGNDNYDAGTGLDILDYSLATSSISLDTSAGTASGTDIGSDTLTGFETYRTGSGADSIQGSLADEIIQAGDGGDIINSRGGTDIILAEGGNDQVIVDTSANAFIDAGTGSNEIRLEIGADGTVQIMDGGGDDTVSIQATAGTVVTSDLANSIHSYNPIVSDYGIATYTLGVGVLSDLVSFRSGELVEITGEGSNEASLSGIGSAVDARITSTGGTEISSQTSPTDGVRYEGDFNDVVLTTAGDNFEIQLGDDLSTIVGRNYNLGSGLDTFDASARIDNVDIDLGTGVVTVGVNTFNVISAEEARTGSGADSIRGTGSNETILAGAGGDTINAGGGADTIMGEGGDDQITVNTASNGTVINAGSGSNEIRLQTGADGTIQIMDGGGDDTLNFEVVPGTAITSDLANFTHSFNPTVIEYGILGALVSALSESNLVSLSSTTTLGTYFQFVGAGNNTANLSALGSAVDARITSTGDVEISDQLNNDLGVLYQGGFDDYTLTSFNDVIMIDSINGSNANSIRTGGGIDSTRIQVVDADGAVRLASSGGEETVSSLQGVVTLDDSEEYEFDFSNISGSQGTVEITFLDQATPTSIQTISATSSGQLKIFSDELTTQARFIDLFNTTTGTIANDQGVPIIALGFDQFRFGSGDDVLSIFNGDLSPAGSLNSPRVDLGAGDNLLDAANFTTDLTIDLSTDPNNQVISDVNGIINASGIVDINTGSGDDRVVASYGDNQINLGTGNADTMDYTNAIGSIIADISESNGVGQVNETDFNNTLPTTIDTLTGIERIVGSSFTDNIQWTDIEMSSGNGTLAGIHVSGGGSADQISLVALSHASGSSIALIDNVNVSGDDGNDILSITAEAVSTSFPAQATIQDSTFSGGIGNDSLTFDLTSPSGLAVFATINNNNVDLGADNDLLDFQSGPMGATTLIIDNNSFDMAAGQDVMRLGISSGTNNTYDGGSDSDILDATNVFGGVDIDLVSETIREISVPARISTVTDFEEFIGSGFNDIFTSDSTDSVFTGGLGADVFEFESGLTGNDTITDFDISSTETIRLINFFTDFNDMQTSGAIQSDGAGGTLLVLSPTESLTVENVDPINLTAGDFLFS